MRGVTSTVSANLAIVRDRITQAAVSSDRQPEEIRLIAVSKTQSPLSVSEAIEAGQLEFGENTVQDALTKIPRFASHSKLVWHFIGHLQSNKARFLPTHFQWWHSLDSVALARRVSRLMVERGTSIETLFEVNMTRDPARHGVHPEKLFALLDELLTAPLPGLRLRGLMTLGPHPANEKELRTAFASLRMLRDNCLSRYGLVNFTELSMGMSGDFSEAVREGSTMVRIGTAIFGGRNAIR